MTIKRYTVYSWADDDGWNMRREDNTDDRALAEATARAAVARGARIARVIGGAGSEGTVYVWSQEEAKAAEEGPRVRLVLDLATGHLPEAVCLNLNGFDGIVAYDHIGYGWLLWVPDDPAEHAAGYGDTVPRAVLTVQRRARKLGCDYVLLDRDGPRDPRLPFWDW